jgi:hypothetical protein
MHDKRKAAPRKDRVNVLWRREVGEDQMMLDHRHVLLHTQGTRSLISGFQLSPNAVGRIRSEIAGVSWMLASQASLIISRPQRGGSRASLSTKWGD